VLQEHVLPSVIYDWWVTQPEQVQCDCPDEASQCGEHSQGHVREGEPRQHVADFQFLAYKTDKNFNARQHNDHCGCHLRQTVQANGESVHDGKGCGPDIQNDTQCCE